MIKWNNPSPLAGLLILVFDDLPRSQRLTSTTTYNIWLIVYVCMLKSSSVFATFETSCFGWLESHNPFNLHIVCELLSEKIKALRRLPRSNHFPKQPRNGRYNSLGNSIRILAMNLSGPICAWIFLLTWLTWYVLLCNQKSENNIVYN